MCHYAKKKDGGGRASDRANALTRFFIGIFRSPCPFSLT
jgi:hypothetical protein